MTDDDIHKKLAKEMTLQWQVNDAWTQQTVGLQYRRRHQFIYTRQARKTFSAVTVLVT